MKRFFAVALIIIMVIMLASCSGKAVPDGLRDARDLPGKTVGVMRSSETASYMRPFDSTVKLRYYEDAETMAVELKNKGIDCAIADESTWQLMQKASSKLTVLDEKFVNRDYSIASSVENKQMGESLESAITQLAKEETLEKIANSWRTGENIPEYSIDESAPAVHVAVDPTFEPYCYYDENGELAGIEISVTMAVCAKLGLRPEFQVVEPDLLLYMAESGKVSFAIGRIVDDGTDDAVAFTDAYIHSTQYIVVRKG